MIPQANQDRPYAVRNARPKMFCSASRDSESTSSIVKYYSRFGLILHDLTDGHFTYKSDGFCTAWTRKWRQTRGEESAAMIQCYADTSLGSIGRLPTVPDRGFRGPRLRDHRQYSAVAPRECG